MSAVSELRDFGVLSDERKNSLTSKLDTKS